MKLYLSISLFLVALIDTQAEVSDNFENCLNFFYKEQIPKGFEGIARIYPFAPTDIPDGKNANDLSSPAYICQIYQDKTWFATLYDRGRRMPLYSAYVMDIKPIGNKGNKDECETNDEYAFKLEPQLIYRGMGKNMLSTKEAKPTLKKYLAKNDIQEKEAKNRQNNLLKTSQTVLADYETTGYQRGHLNPCMHQNGNKDKSIATFTLTNMVPMVGNFNNLVWWRHEKSMIKMSAGCAQMYVITGIVPGNVPIKESGLTAPTHVWNAYCCVDNNGKPIKSGAGLGENRDKSDTDKNRDKSDTDKNKDESKIIPFDNLSQFESELQSLLGVKHDIVLFEGGCRPQDDTPGPKIEGAHASKKKM